MESRIKNWMQQAVKKFPREKFNALAAKIAARIPERLRNRILETAAKFPREKVKMFALRIWNWPPLQKAVKAVRGKIEHFSVRKINPELALLILLCVSMTVMVFIPKDRGAGTESESLLLREGAVPVLPKLQQNLIARPAHQPKPDYSFEAVPDGLKHSSSEAPKGPAID